MGRFAWVAVFALVLAGCVPIPHEPARDEFGVSASRADAGTAPPAGADMASLERKAQQSCVHAYTQTRLDTEPAESGQQIIDMKLRCGQYNRLDFDYFRTGWSNLL